MVSPSTIRGSPLKVSSAEAGDAEMDTARDSPMVALSACFSIWPGPGGRRSGHDEAAAAGRGGRHDTKDAFEVLRAVLNAFTIGGQLRRLGAVKETGCMQARGFKHIDAGCAMIR